MVTVITRVADFLQWQRFNYLGHSLGGQIGVFFAAFYPERIIKLIMLDVVRPRPLEAKNFIPAFRSVHKKLLASEKKISKTSMPCYTYEEAKQRMFASRYSELTDESADILLQRSLVKYNGGYVFGQDQRLKFFVFPPYTNEQQLAFLNNVRCSLLIIKTRESLPIFTLKGVKLTTEMYRRNCAHYEELTAEGNHDVHINHPDRVDTLISNFLLHSQSHL